MNQKTKKKVVILGGGFGGLYAYRSLYKHFRKDDIEVTLVNKTNYFLFTPLLHEVATGGLSDGSVVESIQHFLAKNNDTIHVASVISVDPKNQTVTTSVETISYDVLIVALGASTQYFGTLGAEEYSVSLKDLSDAVSIRGKVIEAFQKASVLKDKEEKKNALSFTIVGGGPTGVELGGELAEFIHETLVDYYNDSLSCEDISITLINQTPELLAPFPPVLRAKALEVLQNKKIKVLLGTGVKEVRSDSVVLSNDEILKSSMTIWTAGVKPNTEIFKDVLNMNKGGRIFVNEYLQSKDYSNIFAVGDVAFVSIDDHSVPMPMTAQVAVRQGPHVASNIKAFLDGSTMIPFEYESRGELASLGRYNGLAHISGLTFSGAPAWFLWRTVYLFKFISNFKKIKVAFDWTMNLFFSRDITKI